MDGNTGKKKKVRFRRISRARILDGHPLKPGMHAVLVLVFTFASITSIIFLLFAYFHGTEYILVFWALLPGAFLGLILLVLERSLGKLKSYMFPQLGRLLTAFLLFFIHIIGYLAFSSIVVGYPLDYIMENIAVPRGTAGGFSLFSVNFFIVFGLFSWLRNVRSAPSRCF